MCVHNLCSKDTKPSIDSILMCAHHITCVLIKYWRKYVLEIVLNEKKNSNCGWGCVLFTHLTARVLHALEASYKVREGISSIGTPTTVLKWRLSTTSPRAIHLSDFIITRHRVWIHTAKWNSWKTNGTWQILLWDRMLISALYEKGKKTFSLITMCGGNTAVVVVVVVGSFKGLKKKKKKGVANEKRI